MRMKNKRGFLLAEETLKIVIALISLSFLIFFLISLYFSNVNDVKSKQAEQILIESDESIKQSIQNLDDSESKELILDNPNGWYLFGFTNLKPNVCAGDNCLCICDRVYDDKIRDLWKSWEERQIEKCSNSKVGICTPVKNLKNDLSIEIKDPRDLTRILIKKENNEILIQEI